MTHPIQVNDVVNVGISIKIIGKINLPLNVSNVVLKFHADYNAAKNISVYNIEKVIQKQLKLQEKLNLTKYKEQYIEQMENIN